MILSNIQVIYLHTFDYLTDCIFILIYLGNLVTKIFLHC